MNITIKDRNEFEKPRERALSKGVDSLSLSELIAIILTSGSKNKNVYEISNEILLLCSDLEELNNITVDELCTINGLGKAKALKLICSIELGKRVISYKKEIRKKITSPTDIVEEFNINMKFLKREEFRCVLLDTKNSIISTETISIGSLNSSIVHPREVFNLAVRKSAASIILVHNHPSGNTKPSTEDISVTKRLKKAGKILGIDILDHIIIGDSKYFSFRENNTLND